MEIETNSFKFIYNKYFTYFLGFLWSDGFIERQKIGIEVNEDDALNIIEDIKKIDFLKICTMNRHRKNRKPQMTIYFCNVKFYDKYIVNYFIDKSESSPFKLINNIPENLRRYFYLGLIDGDGCFYISKNFKTKQFYITSSYNQDWTYIEDLFKDINITQYEIRRVISNKGDKSSFIRIKKYNEILKLHNYLYPELYEIGLKRKYNKCKLILENKPICDNNTSKLDIKILENKINEGFNINELSKLFNCCWRKIYNFCKKNNVKYGKGFFKSSV